jgi:2-haloacid dehalogenase
MTFGFKTRITSVAFDLGGVMIDWNPRYLYRSLFGADEAAMEQFLAEICTPDWNARFDAGRPFAEGIAETAAAHPDQADLINAYWSRWPEMLGGALAGSVQIMRELRAAGLRTYALSNWSAETFPMTRQRFPFLSEMDGFVLSGEVGVGKPDPEMFRELLARFNLSAEETVFIDDSDRNVDAAASFGIVALQFVDAARLRQDLVRLGLPIAPEPTLAGLPDPKALLFDLDGTLVDTVRFRAEAWRRAFASSGMTVDPAILPRYMGSDGRWLAGEVGRSIGRELDWAARDELDRAAGANFDELNVSPATLPGATELLTMLEASNLTFAIATASQPGQVAVSVSALRLPAPPRIIDGGNVEHAKPAPDLLLVAAEQVGVEPGLCWYVGDSAWDMMAGAAAGMAAVGVTTGATDAAALVAAGASVVIPGLPALLDELRRRGLV